VIRLPPRSPNLNAYAERFVRSVKEECIAKMIPIGEGMLRRALREYLEHYHRERNHQGVGNVLLMPSSAERSNQGPVTRWQRLGGLLNYYDRAAA
jgi:putative transposase